MTAAVDTPARDALPPPPRAPSVALAPLSPRAELARAALIVIVVVSVSLMLELLVVSGLQQRAAQQRLFDNFRGDLALGTAPTGPKDLNDDVLAMGDPVAYMEVPAIGLRQVVVEGTLPSTLFEGPGHRRDTPLPGQEGTSIIMGRRAAFGGPFARLADLDEGDAIRITTGQGTFDYEVLRVRRDGDPAPNPPREGKSRLLLATADGGAFVPNGVLRVDAKLTTDAVGGPSRLMTSESLPASEQFMASDTETLFALLLWLQLLVALVAAAVWTWHRWGRAKAWVVFLPPLLLVGVLMSNEAARLMPNLL
jgi:LPXTG-site transpeptidase (sortase) family protein